MQRTRIRTIGRFVGQDVTIQGWLYQIRSSGKIHFLQIRDGSGIVQAVGGKNDLTPEVFELAKTLTLESSVSVTGTVRADARAPGGFELSLKDVVLHQLAPEYPIQPKEHGIDFLMSNRHLWLRSKRPHAILTVRDTFIKAIRDFFYDEGFVLVDAPILTPAACEGTTTLFETEYFGDKAYLSQSGQLYMEAAAMAFGKVYCFGPTFRAEKSKTRRHLTEFWMIEPEMAYATIDEVMDVAERLVEYTVGRVLEKCRPELSFLERDVAPLERVKAPFPKITYDEAVERLHAAGVAFEWGGDFGAPDETLISNQFDRPVFVKNFPAATKAFYMKADPARPEVALGADLLASEGYGEIIGGGQREDDLARLEAKIAEHKLPREAFEWFLDLRKYGSVPHGGFGLGIERTLTWILGLQHVRETIPFPRTMERIYP